MSAAANQMSLAAAGQSQSPEGKVVIAASQIYAAYLLPPILAKLRLAHPGIIVEIVASTRASNLLRRDADIAIRNSPRLNRTWSPGRSATSPPGSMPRRPISRGLAILKRPTT